MPILREPTPQELETLRQQGVDVDKLPAKLEFDDAPKTSIPGAAVSTLKSHAGGTVGGSAATIGAGGLLTGLGLAPFTEGVSLIPSLLGLVGIAGTGVAGSYVGQKGQEAIQGEELTKKLQEEQAQAEKEHPLVTEATDIISGALASGGWPKPSNIPRALKGLIGKGLSDVDQAALSQVGREALSPSGVEALANKEALKNVAIQSVVNPAINTGISLGTTGQLPTVGSFAAQAAGGALFSGGNPLLHRGEPTPEPTTKEQGKTTYVPDLTPNPEAQSPFKQKDENGNPLVDDKTVKTIWRESNPKPDVKGMEYAEKGQALTKWNSLMGMSVEEQRNALHDAFVKKQGEVASAPVPQKEPAPEPNTTVKPEVVKPMVTTDELLGKVPTPLKSREELFDAEHKTPIVNEPVPADKFLPKVETATPNETVQNTLHNTNELNPIDAQKEFEESLGELQKQLGEKQTFGKVINEKPSISEEEQKELLKNQNENSKQPGAAYRSSNEKAEYIRRVNFYIREYGDNNLDTTIQYIQKRLEDTTRLNFTEQASDYRELLNTLNSMKGSVGGETFDRNRYAPEKENDLKKEIHDRNFGAENKIEDDYIQHESKTKLRDYFNELHEDLKQDPEYLKLRGNDPSGYEGDKAEEYLLRDIVSKKPSNEKRLEIKSYLKKNHSDFYDITRRLDLSYKESIEGFVREKLKESGLQSDEINQLFNNPDNYIDYREELWNKNPGLASFIEKSAFTSDLPFNKIASEYEENIKNNSIRFSKNSDFSRYNEIDNQMRSLMKEGKYGSDEFHKLWAEKEAIKNKNGGMPPSETKTITSDKTVGEALDELKNHRELKDSPHIRLLNQMKFDNDTLRTRITTTDKDTFPVKRSYYDSANDIIYFAEHDTPDVLAHEVMHAAIMNKLPSEFNVTGASHGKALEEYLKSGKDDNIKELVRAYLDTADSLGLRESLFGNATNKKGIAGFGDKAAKQGLPHGYAMSDIHEFISNIFNDPKFREHLNSIPSSTAPKQSVWSKLVESFRRLLGVDVKHGNMLERVLHPLEQLAAQERPSGVRENDIQRFAPKKEKQPLSFRFTQSAIDKVRNIQHPLAEKLGDASQKALDSRGPMLGQTWNKLKQVMDANGYNDKMGKHLMEIDRWRELHQTEPPSSMFHSTKEKTIYDTSRQVYDEVGKRRLAINEPVYRGNSPTRLIQDPNSVPHTPDPKIVQEYKENPDGVKVREYDKIFLDNAAKHGATNEQAHEALANWKEGIQGNWSREGGNLQFYNAMRKSQGIPLPEEFSRKDWAKNLEVYYNRAATDNSFYQHVESNPQAMAALGATKDAWGNPIPRSPASSIANHPSVRALIDEFKGEAGGMGLHNEKGLSHLATTLFISWPGLQTHKLISNIIGLEPYTDNPYQYGRVLASAVKNMREGYQHSLDNGVYKLTARSFKDVFTGSSTAAERMQALAHSIRKISSLNEWTEKWNAGLMQAGAEQIIPSKLSKAENGDKTSIDLIKKLDPDYVKGKNYTDQQKSELASRLVGYIHGTGDARTMPSWMIRDSEVSGFFNLAHWSIAQTNRFMSDVITPAVNHTDYKPLINSLFGAAIGGYMIKEIREKLAGKKGQIPSLSEISAGEGGNKIPLYAYNLIAAAQYSGFGGLLSQVARYPFDAIYKNHPQGATFPMDEVITDLASTLGEVTTAIANDPNINWLHLAEYVTGHLLTQNIQLARMGYNQGIDSGMITGSLAEKKELADKLGQLRRFNMVSGLPYNEQDASGNPYMNIEQKKFKAEQNPQEAMKMLPQLINNIIKSYGSKPDVMLEKLKALKQNSYATFPSMESTPLSFMKYLSYLGKTEGPEQAQAALQDYWHHKIINEVKSSVVP